MDTIDDYFHALNGYFDNAYKVADNAKKRGFDPETFIEIKPAPDLASRIEGIIGVNGIEEIIRKKTAKTRQELAFSVVEELCTNDKFSMELEERLLLSVRVGLAILTEGILVAPTEGLQNIKLHKNSDGSDYIAIVYAGPIRGAGGTSAALSVALADYARKLFNISAYRPQKIEVERALEEIMLYHLRIARLQYLPDENDIKTIIENCPVCIDGVPTEDLEVGIHRNVKRLDSQGKEEMITNKVRSGVALVVCEGIAQKAKSIQKHTKNRVDWYWLNNIIKADKGEKGTQKKEDKAVVFLHELVAGRPILAYPDHYGSFRLRYGRSRFTGIAAKGFNPATMTILGGYMAIGTQVKVEKPGKGCISMPVDSIEGPFVKLDDGTAFRINTAEETTRYKDRIKKILSVGDILITLGDFKKTNTALEPTSYVEEFWYEELVAKGYEGKIPDINSFSDAMDYSKKYEVPMHPKYIYDYNDISQSELLGLAYAVSKADINSDKISELESIKIGDKNKVIDFIEKICIPHAEKEDSVIIIGDDAKSLITSLGFVNDGIISFDRLGGYEANDDAVSLDLLNRIAPFKIMQRSTRIGGRLGRPEKAKERLMKPPPNLLFPIGEYGGKERNVMKAYMNDKKKFGNQTIEIETARYRCPKDDEKLLTQFCWKHNCRAYIERKCERCARNADIGSDVCKFCGGKVLSHESIKINLTKEIENSANRLNLNIQRMPKLMKGVKGMINKGREIEAIDKGILRSINGIYVFKDGTSRFDATDAPITHFYPKEIGTSVERLRSMGYSHDYLHNDLRSEDQLVELKHQDIILNRRGGEYLLKIAKFVDDLLERFYKLDRFYNAKNIDDLIGHCAITLSPHTSAGVLCRIIGFTDANVGFAHPYVISARRRNCDGDEDTTMLLLDALINFSKKYLPTSVGGTMDAPLILTLNVKPEEVDDEVWDMEIVNKYSKEFYDKTLQRVSPGEILIERVNSRLNDKSIFENLDFTHESSSEAILNSPKKSNYTMLKTMQDKIDAQFMLMDKLSSIDKADAAKRLILSHFIPDLIGNLHSFSKQTFRCISCNAKYRRVPLSGVCRKCGGKIVLTISKGGIKKYLDTAANLADRYDIEIYIKQRIKLIEKEIDTVFGNDEETKQFNLSKFM